VPGFSTRDVQHYYDDGSREDTLWDWVSSNGEGLMGIEFAEIPEECFQFCLSQYERFKVPFYRELYEAIRVGAYAAFSFVDVARPYALFEGVSDVDMTLDWASTTYRIFDPVAPNKRSYEADPATVESFAFMPGQAAETFRDLLGRPGLDALPFMHGEGIREVLSGDACFTGDGSYLDLLSSDGIAALAELCTGDKGPDTQRMWSYLELAAWASYVWLIGPESRNFRIYHHELIGIAVSDGECLIVEGTIISPDHYTKIDRPPQSCYHCAVQTWCVEHTQTRNHQAYICEACLNFDMPKSKNANCGTKFCTLSACPNHPYHQMGRQGAFQSRHEGGYLTQQVAAKKAQLSGTAPKQLGF
jgi:hypothetical protein